MSGLPDHHGIHIEGTEVGGPNDFLQQLGEQWRGDSRDPLLVAETLAQFAHFQAQAIAVVGLAAAYIAFVLQGFQQPTHRGPVQAGEFRQTPRAGTTVEPVEGVEQGQSACQAAHRLVVRTLIACHEFTIKAF
ncbi:hypothetical protein D9M69_549370 [compost metagenome]